MIRLIIISCLLIGNLLARPLTTKDELRVEASVIAGPDIFLVEKTAGDKKVPKGVERGTRSVLIYFTNLSKSELRIPTRDFVLERKELNEYDLITLRWAEHDSIKRRIVLPVSDLGVVEIGQNETASILFSYPEEWPESRPARIRFIVSLWAMEKYKLDFCEYEVNLPRQTE